MSETLFRFRLTELDRVRLVCQHCQAVVEIAIDQLDDKKFSGLDCVLCGKQVQPVGQNNLALLGQALRGLKALPGSLQVEFVLPVKP